MKWHTILQDSLWACPDYRHLFLYLFLVFFLILFWPGLLLLHTRTKGLCQVCVKSQRGRDRGVRMLSLHSNIIGLGEAGDTPAAALRRRKQGRKRR